jgi:hypothetical protein
MFQRVAVVENCLCCTGRLRETSPYLNLLQTAAANQNRELRRNGNIVLHSMQFLRMTRLERCPVFPEQSHSKQEHSL